MKFGKKFEEKLKTLTASLDYEGIFEYKKDVVSEREISSGSNEIDMFVLSDNKETIYYLLIHDENIVNAFEAVCQPTDIHEDVSAVDCNDLYFSIQLMRQSVTQEHTDNLAKLISFTEKLFGDRYNKIDKMVAKGVLNYESLWYYFDNKHYFYKVEYFDETICFKYDMWNYASNTKGSVFWLFGDVIYYDKNGLSIFEYKHAIPKFTGTKSITLFNIDFLKESEKEKFIDVGNTFIEANDIIAHKHGCGKVFYSEGANTISDTINSRIMVDYKGCLQYSNMAFDFTHKKKISTPSLTNDDKIIVFPFAGIYNLGVNKRWSMIHINNIKKIKYQENALDNLVIDEKKKKIIKTLIKTKSIIDQHEDFIKNKGKNLVFLLHGSPGTGKTYTAEAVCEYLKKPLYSVTVGDLGINPTSMTTIMKNIIKYCSRWDAIILIDEVDVFIEHRETNMITRNAMVSVFLKLLEYYKGIFFLTTNRLTSIDPAVKSRINLMILYKKLQQADRLRIWNGLLNKWNINVDVQYVKRMSNLELNGREIRNYLKIILANCYDNNIFDNSNIDGKVLLTNLKEFIDINKETESNMSYDMYS